LATKSENILIWVLVGVLFLGVIYFTNTEKSTGQAAQYCLDGDCGPGGGGCTSECYSGARRCATFTSYQVCGNYDSDSCLEWGGTTSCGTNEQCLNGYCQQRCTNECTSGSKECSGNGYRVCGNYDSDSCLEWGSVTSCGTNEVCVGGFCASSTSVTLTSTCSDSDGGIAQFVKGRVTVFDSVSGISSIWSDLCFLDIDGKFKLAEEFCSDPNLPLSLTQFIDCSAYSKYCIDGACRTREYICGNGIIEEGEQCDGNNLDGYSCQSFGYESGTLDCDDCVINYRHCVSCKDSDASINYPDGNNPLSKGHITFSLGQFTVVVEDYCIPPDPNSWVVELMCTASNVLNITNVFCSDIKEFHKCVNGACIYVPPVGMWLNDSIMIGDRTVKLLDVDNSGGVFISVNNFESWISRGETKVINCLPIVNEGFALEDFGSALINILDTREGCVPQNSIIEQGMHVNSYIKIGGRILKLVNVGEGGAVLVDVNGIRNTISLGLTKEVGCLPITNIETHHEQDIWMRTAMLRVGDDRDSC